MTAARIRDEPKASDIMDLLLELGADPGLKRQATPDRRVTVDMAELAASTLKGVPMIHVPDIRRTLDWYAFHRFKEIQPETRPMVL